MKIGRLIKGVLISLAILFVTFQPIMVPVAYAVESWTGNPWEGNPWEGDSWDGSDLEWEGKSWTGDLWEGKDWTGKGTDGQSWDSYDWESTPWYLKGWTGNGSTGNSWGNPGWTGNGSIGNAWGNPGWTGNGSIGNAWGNPGWIGNGSTGNPWLNPAFSGNGSQGTPWASPGFLGNGYLGNPWLNPGFTGNGSENNSWSGEGNDVDPMDVNLPNGYEVGKYVVKDVIGGQVNFVGNAMNYQNLTESGYNAKFDYGGRMGSDILMNGLKLGVGDHAVFDAYDTTTHTMDGIKGVQDFRQARQVLETTDDASDLAGNIRQGRNLANAADNGLSAVDALNNAPKPPVGALSKLNVGAAAVGAGVSAFETGFKSAKAVAVINSDATGAEKTSAVADAGTSLGDTLMNAGVVATAIPGGQAVGAGMVAAGAGIWVVSKGVKLFADNWKGDMWSTTKSIGKKAGKAISDGWNTVKGWFS